jgi:two-component system sensor histidine kinase HupT/HoxJ
VHALSRYRDRLLRYCAAVDASDPSPPVKALKAELRIDRLLADLDPLIKGTLEGAERVRDLVQDLRCFSSGQQGERTAFDLVHLVRTAVHWVIKGDRRDLEQQLDLPEQLLVEGHPGQIHQVVMNLVQNALDATRGQKTTPLLMMRIGRSADTAWLTVRDNGGGISPENLGQIFDPFFTTKPVGQGTGLGLSISYRIVSDHGGSLTADNHPDGGAEFRLELPLAETGASNRSESGRDRGPLDTDPNRLTHSREVFG